jgi:hypothetical protein
MATMHFIGLDIHKKTISYCMKDPHGRLLRERMVAATRQDLDAWMKSFLNRGPLRWKRPCSRVGSMTTWCHTPQR